MNFKNTVFVNFTEVHREVLTSRKDLPGLRKDLPRFPKDLPRFRTDLPRFRKDFPRFRGGKDLASSPGHKVSGMKL